MEYAIVEAASAAELQQKVTERMNDGWMPAGGVAVAETPGGPTYCQAVVWLPDDDEDIEEGA